MAAATDKRSGGIPNAMSLLYPSRRLTEMSVSKQAIRWLTVLLIAVVLAVTALPVSVLLDQLAGTSLVSHVWAGDEVSATGGG